jgi:LmbE family N-acetylglucosaminyl deacetylase
MTTTYYGQGNTEPFEPSIIVDVSTTMDRKKEAIAQYASQKTEALLADVESQNRLLGARIGARYAEGFKEYPLFGLQRSAARPSLADIIGTTPRNR